jgi:hypothetical protein
MWWEQKGRNPLQIFKISNGNTTYYKNVWPLKLDMELPKQAWMENYKNNST